MPPEPFRVAFVPGVTPDKWARTWAERLPRLPLELLPVGEAEQESVLYEGRAAMCFLRLPADRDRLHVIPLYEEQPVVVAPKGHFVEAADEVTLEDLAGEHLLAAPPLTTGQAVETVAAGTGIIVVPLSVARLHHRKDVVHRPVVDLPTTQVGLAWLRSGTTTEQDELLEVFIGIVRGRRATSSRGPTGEQSTSKAKPAGAKPRPARTERRKAAPPRRGGSRRR